MSTTTKDMDIKEFRAFGYLQELNRQFLHPLGLVLEVVVMKDGTEKLGGIWDYRLEPAGIRYDHSLDPDKAHRVLEEQRRLSESRQRLLGYIIQPLDEYYSTAG